MSGRELVRRNEIIGPLFLGDEANGEFKEGTRKEMGKRNKKEKKG